jgi:hypothetical protein
MESLGKSFSHNSKFFADGGREKKILKKVARRNKLLQESNKN